MPRIYDCFTYNNEDLLLSLRLETLNPCVDKFVIAESPFTHTGKPKPLYFDPSRFGKFADKIIHLVVEDMPLNPGDSWANEMHQRNALERGLTDARPSDWVIISDVDEIPHPDAIARYRPWNLYGTFIQKLYCYFFNNLAVQAQRATEPRWWVRSKITTLAHLREFFGTPQNLRIYKPEPGFRGALKQLHRKIRHQRLHDGGWHFSWLMTPEEMIKKMESFAHTEFDQPHLKSLDAIRSAIHENRDILGKGERFRLTTIDDSFPPYLMKNLHLFREWYLDPTVRAHPH
jgi:beta-1,4-mannosyl-glycoprotein beta-1,4-N-acetylglucosaminyltransferase